MSEHAVIVKFKYAGIDLEALHALEDKLTEAIEEAGGGECDGHDVTPDLREATIYLYGADAEFLFVVAQQVLENSDASRMRWQLLGSDHPKTVFLNARCASHRHNAHRTKEDAANKAVNPSGG